MDSLTHIVFGAVTGEILLGRKLGNKAMLLGAIGANIPDIDMVYNLFSNDPIKNLVVHRSYTHAFFIQLLLAFPLAWLSRRMNKAEISFRTWYSFWGFLLITHSILDSFTTYGTQLLLPFTNKQVAFNNLSIIDPLYTIPFLLIFVISLFFRRGNPLRRKFLKISLVVSCLYLLLTFVIKFDVHHKFEESLAVKNIEYDELNSTPTILNSILWNAIAIEDSMIYTADYSYLKPETEIQWIGFKRNQDLLKKYDSKSLRTIAWFSDGNYFMRQSTPDTLDFYNVKWGRARYHTTNPDSTFIFYWKFYFENNEVKYKEVLVDWKFKEVFGELIERIGIISDK